METNYELKHKCLLVPLKAVLLVLAMVLVGFTTYAQQGKAVKVANDQQLTEALRNPSIGVIELEPGYYASVNYNANSGTTIRKAPGSGNRNLDCQYFIFDANVCTNTAFYWDGEYPPAGTYIASTALAGTFDPGCGCCPGVDAGIWSYRESESFIDPSDTLYFIDPLNSELMNFFVTGPGAYSVRYTWGAPYNSYVQSEYVFRGPNFVDLTAPDVCGLSTMVDFTLDGLDIFTFNVVWTATNSLGVSIPVTGPQETGQFEWTVPECGMWELTAAIYTTYDPNGEEDDCIDLATITVEFSCEPWADAGPDVNVCDDVCVYLEGSVGVYGEVSPSFAYSWINLSGPDDQQLSFDPQSGTVPGDATTYACTPEQSECPYGEYVVQLQVQNGLCYADDDATVRFYEQPDAIAGPDQHLCNTFSFDLTATPYQYCGEEGVNYWSESYWEVVSMADPDAVITFDPDVNSPNATVTISSQAECPYGEYTFKWVERNAKPAPTGGYYGGCYDEDFVSVFIYEDPEITAGEDMVLCNTFAFSLYGIGDQPCYENTVVKYKWEKTAEPGNCNVTLYYDNVVNPWVVIDNCEEGQCPYGKYTFNFTQCNGYYEGEASFVDVCCTTDDVNVWIMEEPAADAGPDQALCYSFNFNLAAVPTEFCGEAGVNYFTWGEWSFVDGPAPVEFSDVNDPNATVTILADGVDCPYGSFTFKWTEYNGFGEGEGFEGCWDEDFVTVTIFETPEVNAGNDMEFCDTWDFQLDGTADIPCTQLSYRTFWQLIEQPGTCYVNLMYDFVEDPFVMIRDCDPCQYGEYVFRFTQQNGYWIEGPNGEEWVTVCEDSDDVSVWIYQQPTDVNAGPDQNLCDMHEFTLTGTGSDYCGEYGINYFNSYEWTLVSQPAGADCDVIFDHAYSLITGVTLDCAGDCPYGEFVFRLTERNGSDEVYCEASDEVSIFIFETPVADAGDDLKECVQVGEGFEFCGDMTGTIDYCYSMYGQWSKSCGPGNVVFENINDPNSAFCLDEPGRYKFEWTVWNDAEGCEDVDEVIFDLIESPDAYSEYNELTAPCDELCIDLGLAYVQKYQYIGEEWDGQDPDACPNYWDNAYWEVISGPGAVTFADDTDPATEMCVSAYGCYTVRWNEVNKSIDGEVVCSDYVDIFVQFVQTPIPNAGEDASVCDNCYTFDADPYIPENCSPTDVVSYWMFYNYVPPTDPCPTDDFVIQYSAAGVLSPVNSPNATFCLVDDCLGTHYGTYGFIWVNGSGECVGYDTVYIEFKKKPAELALEGYFNPSNCYDPYCPDCWKDCMYPNDEVLEVCANSCLNFHIDWGCACNEGPIPGYTYEWSFIGPSGSYMSAEPFWYDCAAECWRGTDYVNICFGECCDTARLYLTITAPNGCTTTEEWKFYVNHLPCAEIEGPEVSEVGALTTYCNVCPQDYDMSCLLYTWTAEHCGNIVGGQGTECIEVEWTNYNVNGGWGEITLTTYDTCTGCCNYDQMSVKVHPAGTLGDASLSGHVTYANNFSTPLNGVEVTLWNGGVPVLTTTSFNDIEGGNGPGYYEFSGINGSTNFGITASYDAMWYGANATDALAVELYWANGGVMPGGFVLNPLVEEAMDANNMSGINGTDALWIKQRAISMVNYFPAGDWAYWPSMSSTAGVYDIPVLNMGDANRSNIPNSMKSMPAIDLVTDGTMNVTTGEVFDLPIRLEKADVFGAITLSLDYNPSLIEVVDVNAVEGLLSNISNGSVNIAWSHVNPMVLADNDVVVTLKVKALSEIADAESMFSVGINSEFADASAKVVEPVRLKTFGITTGPAATDYFLAANRPNPFSNTTTIEYTLPESGKVKLSVLDMLGQELEVLVEATQTAGTYSVDYSAAGLATGVYLYKITVDGESRDFISTQRMIVSH